MTSDQSDLFSDYHQVQDDAGRPALYPYICEMEVSLSSPQSLVVWCMECRRMLMRCLEVFLSVPSLVVSATMYVDLGAIVLWYATYSGTSDSGNVEDEHFVHCLEVVPSLEVELYGQYVEVQWKL